MRGTAQDRAKGDEGEAIVRARLDRLPPPFRVQHNLDVPGSTANIDHLVIGPGGLVNVDSKNWSGPVRSWKDSLWFGGNPIGKTIETSKWESSVLGERLDEPVSTVLCFVQGNLASPAIPVAGATAVNLEALISHLTSQPVRLGPIEIERLARRTEVLVRPSPSPSSIVPTSTTAVRVDDPPKLQRRPLVRPSLRYAALVMIGFAAISGATALVGPAYRFFVSEPLQKSMSRATTPAVSVTASEPASSVVDSRRPAVAFTCDQANGGWFATVTAGPDSSRGEPPYLWFRTLGNNWKRWGPLKSGALAPRPIGPLAPGEAFTVGLAEGSLVPATRITDVIETASPAAAC